MTKKEKLTKLREIITAHNPEQSDEFINWLYEELIGDNDE